jgi:FkbM family methyltransferase
MLGMLINCIKHFGPAGLLLYLRIKLKRTSPLPLPGYRHPIHLRNSKGDFISFREIFFKKEYALELPPAIKPIVIIDTGANIGLTSVFFANRYPDAKIICIEPDTENFKCVVKNVSGYNNITPLNKALWHTTEMLSLANKGFGDRGFMIEEGNEKTTEGISLSAIMQQHGLSHIDILKIDIEGSEKEVFSAGYEHWLPKTKCLVIELHDRMKPGCSDSVFAAIANYDFSKSIKGENLVFINSTINDN